MVSLATSAGVTPAMRSTVARFEKACAAWVRRSPAPTSWPVESTATSPDTYTVDPTFTAWVNPGRAARVSGLMKPVLTGTGPDRTRPGAGATPPATTPSGAAVTQA